MTINKPSAQFLFTFILPLHLSVVHALHSHQALRIVTKRIQLQIQWCHSHQTWPHGHFGFTVLVTVYGLICVWAKSNQHQPGWIKKNKKKHSDWRQSWWVFFVCFFHDWQRESDYFVLYLLVSSIGVQKRSNKINQPHTHTHKREALYKCKLLFFLLYKCRTICTT